jgi:DNA-binding transcriptional ArsR family regulator
MKQVFFPRPNFHAAYKFSGLYIRDIKPTCMNSTTTNPTGFDIETITIKNGARIFRALNNSTRQRLLHLIHSNGKMSVTELYVKMNLEQPVASSHLGILRQAGFVSPQRMGRNVYYSINYSRLSFVEEISDKLLNGDLSKN